MSGRETRELGRLAFDELRGAVGGIGQIHHGIAGRVFRLVGPGGTPIELAHDAIAHRVYGAVDSAFGAAGRAAGMALRGHDAPVSTTPRGAALIAALNGLVGDRLEREGSELAETMTLRVRGEAVPPERAALAAAYPAASSRLVVFLHGLMESEFAWGRPSYGDRLARELPCTALYVRYNSGRHISENGRALAELLDAVVAAWPVRVEEIALVGHSMGGLIARSACYYAVDTHWVRRVRHVVSLGSPHMGAPLEQAVHYASAALSALPETRPFGSFLRRRSAGIRDLRQGSLVDEDWKDRHPDALMRVACQEVPLLDGATHCFVAATVTRSPKHPIARLIGDWLVLEPSASGRSRARRIPFKAEHGMHVGGATHLALLNHPAVYERLREWLSGPTSPAPVRSPPRGPSRSR
jgi:pimeloyl-ACP methyl ester carboxylesterase